MTSKVTVKLAPGAMGLTEGRATTSYSSGNLTGAKVLLHANSTASVLPSGTARALELENGLIADTASSNAVTIVDATKRGCRSKDLNMTISPKDNRKPPSVTVNVSLHAYSQACV